MIGGSILLDRKVVREFLEEEFMGIEIPDDITNEAIVEAFYNYVEDDYYNSVERQLQIIF